ncbi:MAG: type IV secretion system DNA-binding domain-containing protein [Pseudomonadota bacterium]
MASQRRFYNHTAKRITTPLFTPMILQADAFFYNDLILYDNGPKHRSVAKGFRVELPPLQNAPNVVQGSFEDALRLLLRSTKQGCRLQCYWGVDNNYTQALLSYHEHTQKTGSPNSANTHRSHHFVSQWRAMEEHRLRREYVLVFINQKLTQEHDLKAQLDGCQPFFTQQGLMFDQLFSEFGGRVYPMDDHDHFHHFVKRFNPTKNPEDFPFDPLASMQENCFHTEPLPVLTSPSVAGFCLDGLYHGFITLKSSPQSTYQGLIHGLTALPLHGYSITTNVAPLDVAVEIGRLESAIKKLRNGFRHHPTERLKSSIDTVSQHITHLMSGEVVPFDAQMIVQVTAPSKSELNSHINTVESAILRLNGAHYQTSQFTTTARNLFVASLPGWTRHHYRDGTLTFEDHHLANLLPMSASATGLLQGAEAIYSGSNGSLVGIKTFAGKESAPQHAFITGITGAGKSVLLRDILAQTEPFYRYTAIIDDGLSHLSYFKEVSDQPPIIVRPEGDVTLNYLDTHGMPLSPQHFGEIAAMVAIMTSISPHQAATQAAMVKSSCQSLYHGHCQRLIDGRHDAALLAARCQLQLNRTEETQNKTLWEQCHDLREKHGAGLAEFLKGQVNEDEADEFLTRHATSTTLRRLIYAFLPADSMPRHRDLVSHLQSLAENDLPISSALTELVLLLEPWLAHGSYGRLVDGTTNVRFSGSHVLIELGQIPESAKELRTLAAFTITNQIRNEIISRPRHTRKRVIIEELGGFLNVPGGDKIVPEFYQRMRKYKCWVVSVAQQSQILDGSPAAVSILGNARMGIFLKQSNPTELDALSRHFPLPKAIKNEILTFPNPSKENGAPFIYYHHGAKPTIASARHIIPQPKEPAKGTS